MVKEYYPEGFICDTVQNKKRLRTPSDIAALVGTGEIVESVAFMCNSEHDLIVDLGCMRGIIRREEGAIGIAQGVTRDIALISRVGKSVCFTVESVKPDNTGKLCAILSRRKAQEICRKEFIEKLSAGDVINARVTHLESFGAFCDIGCGIVALLPIDSISVSRISHPSDRFFVGMDIKVIVRAIMPDGKIMLTHKELLGTWMQNAETLSSGQTVTGVIRSVEDYGIFVELAPNLAGLAEPRNDVYVGQSASVYVKSIIPEKMKVKLIIIDTLCNEYKPQIRYFFEGERMDSWYYSPPSSQKQIITEF
ncbi:MAG: 30S ribosomal protein S1 [Clostridiales bacterium]|nr:30S ribosomal protein S1 [Candidatus Equinaster intestinalis]